MQSQSQKQLKKVSNVEKNFIYECEICYEDYDTLKHVPMIVCSNYHALCAHCVKSNLFKREYNAYKNPTGRYMCSKCSEIIQKEDIREHSILKEVCSYIKNIRKKDEELRKEFYHHVGTMGMNLVAMREDYDVIEKNNLTLKKENQFLVKENCRIRDEFLKIQRVKDSLDELEKVARQVEEMKETLELYNDKLESLKFEIQRKNDEIKKNNQEIQVQKQYFLSLQREIAQLRLDIKTASKRSSQLMEQNQGHINLKEYLEQEINNLQNEKKIILEENDSKKRKVNESLKMMQRFWENVQNGESDLEELDFYRKEERKMKIVQTQKKLDSGKIQNSREQKIIEENPQNEKEKKIQEQMIGLFDHTERFIKNFEIDHTTVTLTNDKLSSFVHISFQEGFSLFNDSTFTVKINKLQSQQIMIGLMTQECKNKKNIYDRKGFYGVDGFAKAWSDGNCDKSSVYMSQGDKITVKYFKDTHYATFSNGGKKDPFVMKLPHNIKHNMLYPVVLLIMEDDSFEVVEVK